MRRGVKLTLLAILSLSLQGICAEEKTLEVELTGSEAGVVQEAPQHEPSQGKEEAWLGLKHLLRHPEILQVERELERWAREKRIALSPWFPNLSASFQWEDSKKYDHPTLGTQEQSRSVSRASVDQLLFDFGEGYFIYQSAVEEWRGARAKLHGTTDRVLYEGLAAALRALLQEKLLSQARASAANFLKQKELEQQKVKGGQGFSTDVLQVDVQYLGAVAKVRQAKLDYDSAMEGVSRWWGEAPLDGGQKWLGRLEKLIAETHLPEGDDLEDWVVSSPALLENRYEQSALLYRKKGLMGGRWGPKVSLRFVSQRGEELGGVGSYDREDRVSLQAELPLNLGGTSVDEVLSMGAQVEALQEKRRALKKELFEDVRVARLTLDAKGDLVATRRSQVAVAQKYLEGAEKERLMGRRSLIDVLNGELLRLQAESEMERARVDRVLAWGRFLQLVGRLGQVLQVP